VPGANDWLLEWESDGPGQCGISDMGYGLSPQGTFALPCQPGTWTIRVVDFMSRTVLGEGMVVVPPGGEVPLVIRLARLP
jgi:hypothetical protein